VGLVLGPWLRLVPEGSRHVGTTGFGDVLFHTPEEQIVRVRSQYGDTVAVPVPPRRVLRSCCRAPLRPEPESTHGFCVPSGSTSASRIDATRSWTAGFDSYDQKNDDCYYRVTVWEGDRDVARLRVVIALSWTGKSPPRRARPRRRV
jgi:hypothetical protein